MKKKWLKLIAFLVIVLFLMPPIVEKVYAHYHDGGLIPGLIIGGCAGLFAASQMRPVVVQPPPPPPPQTLCYREIPERWEKRFNPATGQEETVVYPKHMVQIPCR